MKLSIAVAAAIVFCVVRAAAAEDAASAAEDLPTASPGAGPATELHAPTTSDTIARSQGSTAAVVLVFVMMTVIAYRRLDRTAP
jgi:hypothetical protein